VAVSPGSSIDVNGWHEPARRVRRLQLAQAITLGIGCLASVVLVLVVGRAILGSASDQRRTESQLRELGDIRSVMLAQQAEVWRRRAEGGSPINPNFLADYATFRAGALRLADENAGGDSTAAQAGRAKVRDGIATLDAIISKVVSNPTDPKLIKEALAATDAPADVLRGGMQQWMDAALARGNRAAQNNSDLSRQLLWWIVGLVGALGLVGFALWFGFDRARARLVSTLRVSEERFRSLVQNSSDAVMVIDPAGAIRYASQPTERLFGYRPADLVDMPLRDLVHPVDDSSIGKLAQHGVASLEMGEPIEWMIRHRDGSPRHVESIAARRFDDPAIGGFVLNTRDITERKEIEATLAHRAFHDALTDLANRALFEDRVTHALSLWRRQGGVVAVLMLDLDDFKSVNDTLGHAAGDTALVEVANRLRTTLRRSDTAARLGGDEFVILVETATELSEVTALADRIVEALRQPVLVGGREIFIRGSVGIAVASGESVTSTALLRDADLAMYVAKSRARAGYAVFDPSMAKEASDRLGLTSDLHRALERNELSLAYQPIVDLDTGTITGVEALMRWTHPTRGNVEPSAFIHIAEETDLIVSLGAWALRTATAQAERWTRDGDPQSAGLQLSVNVSTRQLERSEFTEVVRTALADSGFPPHRLTLEITESALMRDPEAMLEQLTNLSTLGITIAIDDFGTGYSSLAYLAKLPIDLVKIDRSFVEGLSAGHRDARIASMIVGIGESLGLRTVAEGVEDGRQVGDLRDLGCRMAQGFYFAHPLSPDALEALVARGPVHAP
jgi:diguanylate cyclase (GGDEF)-like protein/PAS domain S-box-containing protein